MHFVLDDINTYTCVMTTMTKSSYSSRGNKIENIKRNREEEIVAKRTNERANARHHARRLQWVWVRFFFSLLVLINTHETPWQQRKEKKSHLFNLTRLASYSLVLVFVRQCVGFTFECGTVTSHEIIKQKIIYAKHNVNREDKLSAGKQASKQASSVCREAVHGVNKPKLVSSLNTIAVFSLDATHTHTDSQFLWMPNARVNTFDVSNWDDMYLRKAEWKKDTQNLKKKRKRKIMITGKWQVCVLGPCGGSIHVTRTV